MKLESFYGIRARNRYIRLPTFNFHFKFFFSFEVVTNIDFL